MKKALLLTAGLLLITASNIWALSIDNITVTGATNTSGTVTVSADISGAVGTAMATYQINSSDGLSRRYFMPGQVTAGTWSDTNWFPYFTGEFIIDITAWEYAGGPSFVSASTTVTVTRATSGMINSIKYSSAPYDADGTWSNVDVTKVKLHDIGLNMNAGGMVSVGCNLLNATVTNEHNMTEEERDIAYSDTAEYKPAGTPYRFNVSLHARPRGFMGMGEIKRWIWVPTDTNVPGDAGTLTVDITSCSPWRSSYSNALQSHVGMSPLFASGTGTFCKIMCTSAHYMDVGPTNSGSQTKTRNGLLINGHTGTNSYLKMFLSDIFLQQQFQLTNVYDTTNILAGFVQHFDTNGVPIDSLTEVSAGFSRIAGGSNLVYDYNNDGVGDSGYELRFNFEFHSAVAAMMGKGDANQIASYSMLAADFDGDQLADPAVYNTNGTWRIKLSGANYTLITLTNFLGGSDCTALAADFDGDGLADPMIYHAADELWAAKLSSLNYQTPTLLTSFGGSGWAALGGDFDGDGLADPALYNTNGTWKAKLSANNYMAITSTGLLGRSGWTAISADFDGDGKADPAIYQASSGSWIVLLSKNNYAEILLDPGFLGETGYVAMAADFDGDGYADPTVAQAATGNWKIKLSNSNYSLLELNSFLGGE